METNPSALAKAPVNTWNKGFFFWFYVDKDICYLRQASENFVFDLVR